MVLMAATMTTGINVWVIGYSHMSAECVEESMRNLFFTHLDGLLFGLCQGHVRGMSGGSRSVSGAVALCIFFFSRQNY